MVRLLLYCVLGLIFLFQPILAWSNDLTALHEHLNSGEYEKVYELGTTLETSKGYAFAAEALARQVMLGEAKNLKKSSKEARKLAKKSLELDQMNQNALLQHAITDGFVARLSSDVSAWMKKLPQKSFALIETYRDTYPDDARGDALLGAWHLGVARKAGDSNAQKWFGASISEGQRLYDMAIAKEPNDPIIAVNYAFALMALKESEFQDWTLSKLLLSKAILVEPTDDLTEKVIDKAKAVLAIIDNEDAARLNAEAFLDGESLDKS